jgi:hypothetical protein
MIPEQNPIQQIVSILGSFDQWPSFILYLLFIRGRSILSEFMLLNFFMETMCPLI